MSLLSLNETACLSCSLLPPFCAFSFSSLPFILLYFALHFPIFISISSLSLSLYLLLSFYLSVFASFSLSLSLSTFLLLFSFSPPLFLISKSSLPVGCAIKSPYESCFICCVTCCVLHAACCMLHDKVITKRRSRALGKKYSILFGVIKKTQQTH